MADVRLPAAALAHLITEIFIALGASVTDAETAAGVLVRADLAGHGSHGVRLVAYYYERCRNGTILPTAMPAIARDGGSTVILDGNQALGPVAGMATVDLGVERAREHGVAIVTLRRCGHLGRLADYVSRAADNGVIALLAANDSGAHQVVAPYGSHEGRLATNPIAAGIPRRERPHLVLDMATSAVSHGTVEVAQLRGERVPTDWATSENVLLPLGGPKGTGLAMLVDVLGGMLSGAGFSTTESADDYQGVWMLALDPERFLPAAQLETDVETLVAHVRSASPAEGRRVLVPGEPGDLASRANVVDGAPIAEAVWLELQEIAAALDVEVVVYPNERKDQS